VSASMFAFTFHVIAIQRYPFNPFYACRHTFSVFYAGFGLRNDMKRLCQSFPSHTHVYSHVFPCADFHDMMLPRQRAVFLPEGIEKSDGLKENERSGLEIPRNRQMEEEIQCSGAMLPNCKGGERNRQWMVLNVSTSPSDSLPKYLSPTSNLSGNSYFSSGSEKWNDICLRLSSYVTGLLKETKLQSNTNSSLSNGPGTSPTLSLSKLTHSVLHLPLNKNMQCSDWQQRPLSSDQISYAALDAHVLLDIYEAIIHDT